MASVDGHDKASDTVDQDNFWEKAEAQLISEGYGGELVRLVFK